MTKLEGCDFESEQTEIPADLCSLGFSLFQLITISLVLDSICRVVLSLSVDGSS